MGLISSTGQNSDVSTLITDGSSFALVAVALWGAWRVYRFVGSQQLERQRETDRRLAAQRWNVQALLVYVARITAMVPPDREVPPPPELRPEMDDDG